MLSFELFGQFNNVIEARDEFFGLQMEIMADLIGLSDGSERARGLWGVGAD